MALDKEVAEVRSILQGSPEEDAFARIMVHLNAAEGEIERIHQKCAGCITPREHVEAIDVLVKALEFYAEPSVYAPHPHGVAFDRRDISYRAKNALAMYRGVK